MPDCIYHQSDYIASEEDGRRPHSLFFCLNWFQKKEKKPDPPHQVYDVDLIKAEQRKILSMFLHLPGTTAHSSSNGLLMQLSSLSQRQDHPALRKLENTRRHSLLSFITVAPLLSHCAPSWK
ncbi:hypothetical protein AZE42_03938 [Rhizopogon vesiculosus]|uniref:Uncharacterized protein n=1 Tax=Rhizopogon vesiculosus TaxID=180088 RepID=A0A1J8QS04_9AGAM|nr:hypothetical protein AZE42_03938 [Rhizopogon vesiculosus]